MFFEGKDYQVVPTTFTMRLDQIILAAKSVLKLQRVVADFREFNRQRKEPLSFYKVELDMESLSEGVLLCGVWLESETTIPTYMVRNGMPMINISEKYEDLRVFLTDNDSELDDMKGSILSIMGHPEIDAQRYSSIPGHHVLGFLTLYEVKLVDKFFKKHNLHTPEGIDDYFMTLGPEAKEHLLNSQGADIIDYLHKELKRIIEFYHDCKKRKKDVVILYCPGYQEVKEKTKIDPSIT